MYYSGEVLASQKHNARVFHFYNLKTRSRIRCWTCFHIWWCNQLGSGTCWSEKLTNASNQNWPSRPSPLQIFLNESSRIHWMHCWIGGRWNSRKTNSRSSGFWLISVGCNFATFPVNLCSCFSLHLSKATVEILSLLACIHPKSEQIGGVCLLAQQILAEKVRKSWQKNHDKSA